MAGFMSRGRRLTLLLLAPFAVTALVGAIAYEELHEADRLTELYNLAANRASIDASIDAAVLRAVADIRAFARSGAPQPLYDAQQMLAGAQRLVVPLPWAQHPSGAAVRAHQAMLDLVQDACDHAFRALADPDPAALASVLDHLALYEPQAATTRLAVAELRVAEMSANGQAARSAGQASARVELGAVALLACLLVAAIVRGYRTVVRPIGRLASVASQWPADAGQPEPGSATASDVDRLQSAFEALLNGLRQQQMQLVQRESALEQAAADVARVQQRLSLSLDGSKQSIWEWHAVDDAFVVDERWSQIIGQIEGAIDFKASADRVQLADCEWHRHLLEDCVLGGLDHFRAEYRIRREGCDWFWVETNGEVVERDARGRALRIMGTLADISQRKQRELELEQAQGQLLGLVARVDDAVECERQRLTRELHDELGQLLTGIQLDIAWLETEISRAAPAQGLDRLRPELLRDKLEGMTQLTSHAMAVVRNIHAGVRLPLQDGASLAGEMAALVERFGQRTGLRCSTSLEADSGLDRHHAASVFRVCQESLTNIARHAGASCVSVVLGRQRDEFVLEVRDDGRGMADPMAAVLRGGGLAGMRERARLLGGTLAIGSQPARGTTIRLALPCAPAGGGPRIDA